MADKPQRITLPTNGVHVLPFMSSPSLLLKQSRPQFLVVEMTPVEKGAQTEARCQIPMSQDDALRLAILIGDHAVKNGWPLPEGAIVRRTIQ